MEFLDLPVELLERILIISDPIDVSKVNQTCNFLHSLISLSNTTLWRELYLMQEIDDPRESVGQDGKQRPNIDWRKYLQRIIRARTILEDPSRMQPQELERILETLIMLVCYVKPYTKTWFSWSWSSKNLKWVDEGLQRGLLDHIQVSELPGPLRQSVAKLHTYFGLTNTDAKRSTLSESRAFVYLLRNYFPENQYGPFMPDGTVNWVHLRAIRHVISAQRLNKMHKNAYEGIDDIPFPMSLAFTQIRLPQDEDLDRERDWAGITGTWAIGFCFCDHRKLLQFNEMSVGKIETTFFEEPHFYEAFRCLDIKLRIKKTEPDPGHLKWPIIHFFGEMNSSSTSTIAGTIKMTKDNQIQWHFISREEENAIWSSEGVQVGGLRSLYGVLGSWTTLSHGEDDPVGPFWMRKHVSD